MMIVHRVCYTKKLNLRQGELLNYKMKNLLNDANTKIDTDFCETNNVVFSENQKYCTSVNIQKLYKKIYNIYNYKRK